MLRLPFAIVFCAYFIIDLVAADASFTNPIGNDDGTTYNLGQQITISWEGAGNFTALSLGLRQSSTSQIYWIIGSPDANPSGYKASSYLWSIALGNGESLSLGNKFSFWLIDGGYDVQVYSSEFFLRDPTATTITTATTKPSTPTTTTSQSPSKLITTSSSSTTLSTSNTSSPSSTAPASTGTSSGLSGGAIAGIVVGVIAAFALGIGIAYFLFRRRGRSNAAQAGTLPLPAYGQSDDVKDYQAVNTDPHQYHGQGELPGDQPPIGGQHLYQTVHEIP